MILSEDSIYAFLHRVKIQDGPGFEGDDLLDLLVLQGLVAGKFDSPDDGLFLHDGYDRHPPIPIPFFRPDILEIS